MLRLTDVDSELISDIENYQFVESTIRNNIYVIIKGYAELNNKFLKPKDVSKPTSYIIYLETNNLYDHSIMQFLPTEILD